MRLAAYDMYTQSTHESSENLATIQNDYPNVQIKSLPDSVVRAMQSANNRLQEKFAAQDATFARILESIQSYSAKARAWTTFSDKAYLDSLE